MNVYVQCVGGGQIVARVMTSEGNCAVTLTLAEYSRDRVAQKMLATHRDEVEDFIDAVSPGFTGKVQGIEDWEV